MIAKRALLPWPLVVLALLPLLGGADDGCKCSTAKITSATLARGYDAQAGKALDPTNVFKPADTVLHLVVTTAHVPSGTKVGAEWWAVEAGGVKDQKIDAAVLDLESTGVVHFTLSRPDRGWPVGKYKVIVALDGKPNRTLEFEVKE
jgi:hypothetical protein